MDARRGRHALLDHRHRRACGSSLISPKAGFVLLDVLIEHIRQSLGLLRAEEHALKIVDRDAVGSGLIDGAEHQKEVPQADAHLHAVGVAFAIIGGVRELIFGCGLLGVHHFRIQCFEYSVTSLDSQSIQNERIVERRFL